MTAPGRPNVEIQLKLFSILRQKLGRDEVFVEVSAGTKVEELLSILASREPDIAPFLPNCMVAVNREYVLRTQALRAGDEVALIPPVSGGGRFSA